MQTQTTEYGLRESFFYYLFGEEEGYVCICTQPQGDPSAFRQTFFQWPTDATSLNDFIEQHIQTKNIWYGVNMLTLADRKPQFCKASNLVWSDLDKCPPSVLIPSPPCVIESSPERYQAIWRLDDKIDPYLAQEFSKKIAYKYREDGADVSGWNLTRILRVPFTKNFKYSHAPMVSIVRASESLVPINDFETLQVELPDSSDDPFSDEMPTELPDLAAVLYKYQSKLKQTAFNELFDSEPPDNSDWSGLMWRLINISFEAGMTKEEVFILAKEAKCNKYMRDNRPIRYLWREVLKAFFQQRRIGVAIGGEYVPLVMPLLITPDEVEKLPKTFIDDYREWAKNSTDAIEDFHNLAAFMLLSFFISGSVRLPTSSGTTVPNLWGLILGDSTLTRKSTSLRLAMDLLTDIDNSLILASEGSSEGILMGLSGRPNRVSIFFRDEVTGFFDGLIKKDYLAGMRELFTKLYDVPSIERRVLRKEIYEITNPVFIFFGGGIKDRLFQLISEDFVTGGFMPRFIIVCGETDISKIRPTGPPTEKLSETREEIKSRLSDLYESYMVTSPKNIGGQDVHMPTHVIAELTNDAWSRFGEIEDLMMKAGFNTPFKDLANPTFNRMSVSLLKMAVLLAASRQLPKENKITVELYDLLGATQYIQHWGSYSIEMIMNSGRSLTQRAIEKTKRAIKANPGITRGELSRNHDLSKREMDEIVSTLIDRNEIRTENAGRAVRIWPI